MILAWMKHGSEQSDARVVAAKSMKTIKGFLLLR